MPGLRQTLLNNLGIKITSLLLALAAYAHVYARQEQTTVLHLPVVLEKLPEGLTWRGEVPTRIPFRVRMRGTELIKLRAQPPHVVISLENARAGLLQRPVTTNDVVLPAKAEAVIVELVHPVSLSLTIEPIASAVRPVAVPLRGRPAEGRALVGPIRITPETLTISGPSALVAQLDSISTEPLQLDRHAASFETILRLKPPEGLRVGRDEVMVSAELTPGATRSMGPVPVSLPPAWRRAWRAVPESATVVLFGPAELLGSLRDRDLRVQIDGETAPGPHPSLPISAVLTPPGSRPPVWVEHLEPETVRIVSHREED